MNQDLSDDEYEIICVDDGSPDQSYEIVKGFADKYSNIHIFRQQNAGLSSARNTGLSHANGQYIWFIDSDDWIEDNCLSEIYDILTSNKLSALSICAADVIDNKITRRFQFLNNNISTGKELIAQKEYKVCAPFTIYSRDFLLSNHLNFYHGILHEDNEFTPRAYYLCDRIMTINNVLYYVRHTPNSITRSYNPKKANDCLIVACSLHDFITNQMSSDATKVIARPLILALNKSIGFAARLTDKKLQKEYQHNFIEHKYLLKYLKDAVGIKYFLEYLLFIILPCRLALSILFKVYRSRFSPSL